MGKLCGEGVGKVGASIRKLIVFLSVKKRAPTRDQHLENMQHLYMHWEMGYLCCLEVAAEASKVQRRAAVKVVCAGLVRPGRAS